VTFHGIPLSTLAAVLLGGAAVLAALYMLRPRRRRIEVPFLRLWSSDERRRQSHRRLSRLRWPLSFLLQIALLAVLVAALGDPRLEDLGGRHLVILLDASASMTATDVQPSRMARARGAAREVLEEMSGSDRAMIVRLDARPRPLGPFETDPVALGRLVDGVKPSHTAADVARGLAMARDSLSGKEQAEIVLVGDGAWSEDAIRRAHLGSVPLRPIVVGRSGENLAIVAFAARRYPHDRQSFEAYAEVRSYAERPVDARLSILADGLRLDERKIRLAPDEVLRLTYPDLRSARGRVEAHLAPRPGEDHLALDDRASALVGDMRPRRVLLVTEGNLFLEGALLLSEETMLDKVTFSEYRPPPADRYDLVVLDGFTPAEPPRARGLVYIDPSGDGSPVRVGPRIDAPVLEIRARRHPLLRHVALKDVNVAGGRRLDPARGDTVLASSLGSPLMVAGLRGGSRFLALGFDLSRSDLVMRVAFPILLRNVIDWIAGDMDEPMLALAAGRTIRLQVEGDRPVPLSAPDGDRGLAPVVDGAVWLWPDRVGRWRVGSTELAVNLADANESRIAPGAFADARSAARPPRGGARPFGARSALWGYLTVLALLLVLVEWATYHRRVTV